MRPQTLSKFLSALICSFLVGALIHRDSVNNYALGKDAYLAKQAHNFDTSLLTNARMPLVSIIGAVVVLGCVLVFYELLAYAIQRFIAPASPAPENQQLGQGF